MSFLNERRYDDGIIRLERQAMNEANVCLLSNAMEHDTLLWSQLSLWENWLDPRCAHHLSRILRTNYLTYLHLGNNCLGDDGMADLLVLQVCSNLRKLDLWNNKISDRGLGNLILVLKDTSLRELILGTNEITDAGCERLLSSLPSTIENVNLYSNKITANSLTVIIKAMRDLNHLKKLNVDGENPIAKCSTIQEILIREAAKYNCVLER